MSSEATASPQKPDATTQKWKRAAPPSTRAVYPRKRAVTACMVCRGRRTKCDNKKPKCSFCEKSGAECVSEGNDFSGFDPASLEIISRLERIERALGNDGRDENDLTRVQSRTNENGETYDHGRWTSRPGDPEVLLPQNLQKIVKWPVIAPFTMNMAMEQMPSPLTTTTTTSTTINHGQQSTPASGFELDFSVEQCLSLVDDFIVNTHMKNPIFDEAPLKVLVKQACLDGFGWDAQSCLALLVCATGAASMPFESHHQHCSPVNDEIANTMFSAAQRRLGIALDSGGLIQAQAFFLAGQFQMCMLRAYDAWRMFLQSVAACQGFTCVTKMTFPRITTPGDSSLEERIYWSAWKSESELRWELGLRDFGNPAIEYPSLFPTLPEGCDDDHIRPWYFYLSEISLWRIHTAASNEIQAYTSPDGQPLLEGLASLNKDLEARCIAWQQSLAPTVSLGTLGTAAAEDDPSRYVLRGHVSNYYELITWPFLIAVINTGLQSGNVRELAAKGLEWHMNRLLINSPGFFYRHHGTWLMQRSSSRSALVLLAAALTPTAMALLPVGWLELVQATIAMLRFWQQDAHDAFDYANLLQSMLAKFKYMDGQSVPT
jgi:hypothetical protein